ncbi:MAG: sodium:glutamate symporter, partial [Billgrantia desiderata]
MTMTVGELFIALVLISLVLLASNAIRNVSPWLRRLFLPSSVIGGAILLLLGPEVLGRVVTGPFEEAAGLFPEYVFESWAALPGLLI